MFIFGMFVGCVIAICAVLWIDRRGIRLPW